MGEFLVKQTALSHFGVIGQKWGIRRYQDASGNYTSAGKKQYIKDKTSGIQKDIDSFKGHEKGITDNKGRTLLTSEDVTASVAGLKAQKAKAETKAARKYDIEKTTKQLNDSTSTANKLVYNNATRRQAAKYIVDKNMSVADATKKAQGDAWRNTAVFVAGYGALTYAAVKAMG